MAKRKVLNNLEIIEELLTVLNKNYLTQLYAKLAEDREKCESTLRPEFKYIFNRVNIKQFYLPKNRQKQ